MPLTRKQAGDTALDYVRIGVASEEGKERMEKKLREKGAKTEDELRG